VLVSQNDTGGAKTTGPRRRRKTPAPVTAPSADRGDVARTRPVTKAAPPTITRPISAAPFTQQRQQATESVRATRRGLPAPPLAAPPIVRTGSQPSAGHDRPMTRAEVNAFMQSQSRLSQAARHQIVASVRATVGNARGQERVDRVTQLMDDIATDPRLAATRKAIRYYTALEAQTTRPQPSARAIPGRPDRVVHGPGGFGAINLTAASQAAAKAGEAVAPGIHSGSAPAQFVRNAFKDVGTIGSAPFVAGVQLAGIGKDIATGHPVKAAEKVGEFGKAIVEGTIHDWSDPAKYLQEHPVLFGLDVTGAGSAVGRTAGAVGRLAKIERASTIRPPLALGEDLAAGIVERRGSKDWIRREAQRYADSKHETLKDEHGNDVMVSQGGRMVPVLKPRETVIGSVRHPKVGAQGALANKRGDVAASRANAMERHARDEESGRRRVSGIRGRAARDIVAMVTRGVITSAPHMKTDLEGYAARVKANLSLHEQELAVGKTPSIYKHEGEVEAAKANVALVEKVLASPKAMAQAEKIVAEGERHGRALVGHDVEAANAGLFEGGAEQARRARLVETAVEHLGAKHGTDPRLDARILAAKSIERSLRARLNFGHAKTAAERKRLQAQIDTSIRLREGMAARNTERLRDAHGDPLDPHHIEAFLRSRGRDPESVGYLPPNVTRQAFHKQFRPDTRGTLDTAGHIRTGAQHRKGATETSADLIRAAGVRARVTITKAKNIDRLIGEHGMRHPAFAKARAGKALTRHERRVVQRGGYFTGPEAAEAVTRAAARGEKLVAVRAYPGRLDAATQRIIREDLQGPGAMDGLGERLLNDRFLTHDEIAKGTTRNVVLMNQHLVDRLQAHLKPSTSVGKFAQIANRAFRYAVLPQPRWVVGNFFEPMFVRMPGVGSGINVFGLGIDVVAANRAIKLMERHSNPEVRAAAAEIRAHQFGGLLFGNKGLTNRRTLEDFPALDAKAQKLYGQMVATLPATKQMAHLTGMLLGGGAKAILAPLKAIFAINRVGEAGLQRAAFGKAVRREAEEFTQSWFQTLHLGQAALEDVAKGLTNTATQQRFMAAQHELLGKYEGFSPTMRGIIQGPAPFLPWALSAARFVYLTMPLHRSAQTALLVRLNDVVAQDWKDLHQGVPPGMGLAIPTKDGGWRDIARFTPYGLTAPVANGDVRGLTSQFLPQISGVEAALQGKDPFGRDLQRSDHRPATGAEWGVAGNSALEAFVPYLSNIRRLQEHGETAFADSTAWHPRSKPGTSHGMSAARRVLDPFRPTYLSAGASTETVVPARGAKPAAQSPHEAYLARRAARLAHRSAQDAERQGYLERRAARLAKQR
jgi:hypothetical protein